MSNISLNSLFIKNLQNRQSKSVVLKPLNISEAKEPSAPSLKDFLIQKLQTGSSKLISPLQLFSGNNTTENPAVNNRVNILKPLSDNLSVITLTKANNSVLSALNLFENQNKTIIEPGSSTESINALKQLPGKQWLGKLASNGNREAAVIIPEGADYNKPFEVIYYFHGHNGKIAKSVADPSYGFKDQVKEMARDKNIIIVIPQGPPKALDYTWMSGKNNEDMQKFEKDTLDIIKTQLDSRVQIGSVTVKGHSAGGLPIKNAAAEGKLAADRVDFLDASYGNWASSAYTSFIKTNPDGKFNVVYIPGSQTQSDALKLDGKKGVSFTKSNVDHSSVPKTFIAG